ncbi:hypothetical protein CU098_003220, partial [Rhizopus stolonifer]
METPKGHPTLWKNFCQVFRCSVELVTGFAKYFCKAKSKKSSRANKKYSSNKRDDNDEIFLLKRQYREENEYLQKLVKRRKAENDESKVKILK